MPNNDQETESTAPDDTAKVEDEPTPKARTIANTLLVIILVILIGVAIYFLVAPDKNAPVVQQTSSQAITTTTSPTITESTPAPSTPSPLSGSPYETDSIKLTIPDGWTATEGTKNESTDPSVDKQVPDTGRVTITQGNYTLAISADVQPSGGPETGRLSDITQGVASADAVITSQPNQCGTSEQHDGLNADHPRVDLYMSASDTKDGCAAPKAGTVWYFSYIGLGAVNPYQDPQATTALAITMSYNATDVNKLPSKDDPTLTQMLDEMTRIAQTLQLKTQTLAPVTNS